MNELVTDAISKLSDINLNKDQKLPFIEKVALEHVDINALGLYTLGELRKSSTEDDISNYKNAFEKYFLKSLTSRLNDYSSSKFEITGEDKKKCQLYNSKFYGQTGRWRAKYKKLIGEFAKDQDKPLIKNLIVEGLSLLELKENFPQY